MSSPPGQGELGAPLLITAELPPDILAWADAMRRRYFPPEKNRLKAHVTLFHALPPSAEGEVRRLLAELARSKPPKARISGIMNLGRGTALDVDSPGMVERHAIMADRFHGMMVPQDQRELRLHITIQNKVTAEEARQLQEELRDTLEYRKFRFRGFGLYAYEGIWRPIADFPFRG